MREHCIFCAIVAGDAPARVIREDEHTLAFLDINPIVAGHTLVVPKQHSEHLLDTDSELLTATSLAAQDVGRLLTDQLGCDGINLLHATGSVAWQTVFHLHLHVLPRFADDGLAFPFSFRFDPTTDAQQRARELDRIWTTITGSTPS